MKQNHSLARFLALLFFCSTAMAQETQLPKNPADNTLAGELGGKGLLYTLYIPGEI